MKHANISSKLPRDIPMQTMSAPEGADFDPKAGDCGGTSSCYHQFSQTTAHVNEATMIQGSLLKGGGFLNHKDLRCKPLNLQNLQTMTLRKKRHIK